LHICTSIDLCPSRTIGYDNVKMTLKWIVIEKTLNNYSEAILMPFWCNDDSLFYLNKIHVIVKINDMHVQFSKSCGRFFYGIYYLMRRQIDLKVTNSALTDYRLIDLIVRLIGIMRITWCKNVVCVHPAADRIRTGPSTALWPARGKLCQVVASSEWTAAPGPSVGFVSPRKPRMCTRIVCAGEVRTDPARS